MELIVEIKGYFIFMRVQQFESVQILMHIIVRAYGCVLGNTRGREEERWRWEKEERETVERERRGTGHDVMAPTTALWLEHRHRFRYAAMRVNR